MDTRPGGSAASNLRSNLARVANLSAARRTRATEVPGFADGVWQTWVTLGAAVAGLVLDDLFRDTLSAKWEHGWQPAEVTRAARRLWAPAHGDLVATAIASDHARRATRPPEDWSAQLTEIGADTTWWGPGRDWLSPWARRRGITPLDAVATALEALGTLLWLPAVAQVLPPPSAWGEVTGRRAEGGIDEAVLARVRALLAKAESTTFEAEADAFTAKAQELMARHAIDEAMARRAESPRAAKGAERAASAGPGPVARRVPVDDPYAGAKSTLLSAVAGSNGVKTVWHRGIAMVTLVGFETDIQAVQLLYTSLLVQASSSLLAAGQIRDGRGRSRTRSFRQSFYLAFAYRIRERLREATYRARSEAEKAFGADLLPVLVAREEEIDALTEELFPRLRSGRSPSITNREGWVAGRAAADLARLSPDRPFLDRAG